MVLGEFGGMGDGGNARKRGKCQADQCLIRDGGNWNEIGKQLERNWKKLERI